MSQLHITERRAGGDIVILELSGRLVLDEGDVVLRDYINRLVQQGLVNIVLDMKDVSRLDSAGIGMLVSKYVTTYFRGGRLKLLNLTSRGDRLIGVTRLDTVFEVFQSEDDAVRSFKGARQVPVLPPRKSS